MEPLKGVPLTQPMKGWIERLTTRVNASTTKVIGGTVGNIFVVGSDGGLVDSGSQLPAAGNPIDADYVGERFITEAEVPEAGTEEGARYGSYRIGLFTENDYAFFDEYGNLLLYGIAGIRLIVPVNMATTPTMFVVLDANGNIQYRTGAQLASDISSYINVDIEQAKTEVEQWAAERFITEAEVPEAGTEPPLILVSPNGTRYEVTVDNVGTLGTAAL